MGQQRMRSGAGALVIMASLIAVPAVAGPLHITTEDKEGSGYGFRVGQQCVVLTAAHVVQDSDGNLVDAVVADDRAKLSTRGPDWIPNLERDIAYMTTAATNIPSCTEVFVDPAWTLGFDYRANNQALLVARTDRATLRQVPLRVSEVQNNSFSFVENRKGTVASGYSGSLILMNSKPMAIATDLRADRGEVTATSLLAAVQLWPSVFRPEGLRTRIALLPILYGRSKRDDWQLLAIKALQDKPNIQLIYGGDAARACAVLLTVSALERTSRTNPQYTSYRQNCSNTKNILTKLVCPAKAPETYLYDYNIQYTVQTQAPGGNVRVATPSFATTLTAGSLTRAQLDNFLVESSIGSAVDRALQEGGCR